jgi:transposase
MLCDLVDHVIGVDTHRDSHSSAIVTVAGGGVIETTTATADRDGYEALLCWAAEHTEPSERVWAIEGTGSYGAGLTRHLEAEGEWVIEVERPARPKHRPGRPKTDIDDAVRCARDALGMDDFAQPRTGGDRASLRTLLCAREQAVRMRTATINALKADLVTAPENLRSELAAAQPTTARLIKTCAQLGTDPQRRTSSEPRSPCSAHSHDEPRLSTARSTITRTV